MKGSPSDEYDQDLASHHHGINRKEPVVPLYPLEDVELVVEAAAVEFVEYLHPDKSVEDNGVELEPFRVVFGIQVKDPTSCKIEGEAEPELVYGLTQYHLPHCGSEQRSIPRGRGTI